MSQARPETSAVPETPPEPREVELKLEPASGRIEALLDHPALRKARPIPDKSGHLLADYYDTPDHALHRAGLSLRLRERNGRRVQTIKAERGERGLVCDRSEWETPVAGAIDLSAAAGTSVAPLLAAPAIRAGLRAVFRIETDRKVFEVERDGALLEIALDRAKVTAGGQSGRFAEVEIELLRGTPAALFGLAGDLADALPLRLSTTTKSERGYRLLGENGSGAAHAEPVALPPGTTAAEAFQAVARSCLSQVVRNEALLRRSRDPEALHQMRVGLRRLKAALALFKPMLADRESKAVKADLRWIGRKLGRARDLDISLGLLHGAPAGTADDAVRDVEERRSDAYDSVLRSLDRPRFTGAVLHVAAWIEAGRWLERRKRRIRAARGERVEERAAKELRRRWKRIRKRARLIADLNEKRRHRLRMRIKTLRYAVEFFAATFPGDRAGKRRQALLKILEGLQDELGEMNDIAVARSRFSALAKPEPAPGRAEQRLARLLSRARSASRKLQTTKPFWD